MLSQFFSHKENILKKSQEFFKNSSSHQLKIGVELEFFLCDQNLQSLKNEELLNQFISKLEEKLKNNFSLFYAVEKEQGASQIEIKTSFTSDLSKLADELIDAKKFIKKFAEEKNLRAVFAAQPFDEDCGNALQINISLHDENDKNIFLTDEKLLKNTANSLLAMTDEMMIFMAPQEADYKRFSFDLNRNLFKKGKFTAPINLSFGADNRTCAIRIPVTKKENQTKRLEYRIASAEADPQLVLSALILAISQNQNTTYEQIFGNAFDEQYQLKNFCKNLAEAKIKFSAEENFIRKKFEEFSI